MTKFGHLAVAAGLALLASMTSAQTPIRDSGAPTTPTGTAAIAGVVVDAERQPLRRVTVTIAGDQRYRRSVVTDTSGRFAFESLPAGRFTVTAVKAGYPPMSLGAQRPYRPGAGVLLADGQRLTNVTLTLAPGSVLAGTVYDHEGAPMPGIPVMAWEIRTTLSGDRTVDQPQTGGEWVTSDDRGRFRVFGLPPGEYTIGTAWFYHGSDTGDVRTPTADEFRAAFAPVPPPGAAAAPPEAAALRQDYAAVFHPNVVDPTQAATVRLAPGEERDGIDLHMQFRPLSRLEGRIVTPAGEPRATPLVLFRNSRVRGQSTQTHTSSRPDGTFTFGSMAPGDYSILAFTPPAADRPAMWALTSVNVTSADPVNVTMTLQPGMTISGRVQFESTAAKKPEPSQARVALFPATGTSASSNSVTSSVSATGELTIVGVTPGRFLLRGSVAGAPAQTWTLARVMLNGEDVTDVPIDIAPGSAPVVDVVFSDRTTELSGTLAVPPGTPASDYFVVAIPADSRYWESPSRRLSTRADGSGRFVFRGLPAGDYRLAVTTDLVPRDLTDPAALQQLVTQSLPVSIAAGERKIFDVKIGG